MTGAPYKCPAAPWEAALLADALLRQRGVRERCPVAVYTPETQPMPVAGAQIGQTVLGLLQARDIEVHLERPLERIDADARHLVFADGTTAGFEVLLGVPVHKPPTVVSASPLAGPSGFTPVNPATLAVTSTEGVYAIGDVTAVPIGCFLEVGAGRAAYATGDFYAGQGPQPVLHPPARRWHAGKVALERYWLTRWWW